MIWTAEKAHAKLFTAGGGRFRAARGQAIANPSGVCHTFETIADQLHVAWQPVLDLHLGTAWGYEATVHGPADSPYTAPDALRDLALREQRERELELLRRSAALRAAAQDLPESAMLLLAIDPDVWVGRLTPSGVAWPATRTVLELSERAPLFDRPDELRAVSVQLREAGYHIAFTDFGSGFKGAQALLDCRPDIVKIDRLLVHGVDRDAWRQEMVSSIVQTASDLGVAVLAAGIDEVAELHELVGRKIALGAGPLFGRPVPGSGIAAGDGPWAQADADAGHALAAALPAAGAAYAVDRSRHIVAWNDAAANLTGYQSGGVVGVTCWLSGLDHRDAAGTRLCFGGCPLVRAMQTGKPHTAVVSFRTAGGGRKWIETKVRPVTDAQGKVIGAVEEFRRWRKPAESQKPNRLGHGSSNKT